MIKRGISPLMSQEPMFQFSSQSDMAIQSYRYDKLGTEFGY